MTTLTGEFEVTSWDEKPYLEADERKLTRATVRQSFSGDLTGVGEVEWLMCYADDGTAHFVGLQRIESTVDGRDGSVVVESVGDFDGKQAVGDWSVIPGSGTGALSVLRGEGSFKAPMGPKASYVLEATSA
jgi:hypothetical protein